MVSNDDLHNMFKDVITKSSLKHIFFIFIFYVIITSNNFELYFLNIDKKYQNNNDTNTLILKGILFIIIYVFIDILLQFNIL